MTERVLIVNADDFGRSPGVNAGVIRAHQHGIVTSATLMVRWPAATEAADYARESGLSVGLHIDLGEWEYRNGDWHARYVVVPSWTSSAVAAEIEHQLERFEQLMGRPPTHLDSHQHVHRDEPARTATIRAGERLGVPVRDMSDRIAYDGSFFGQDGRGAPFHDGITADALLRIIEALPPGVTELGCHPGERCDHDAVYAGERELELRALCDPGVRAAILRSGVALRSFRDVLSRAA